MSSRRLLKEAVYEMLIRQVAVEGYLGDTLGYTESNVNDLVYGIICPLIYDFTRQHDGQGLGRRPPYLRRKKWTRILVAEKSL